jgi:hypothetical protein
MIFDEIVVDRIAFRAGLRSGLNYRRSLSIVRSREYRCVEPSPAIDTFRNQECRVSRSALIDLVRVALESCAERSRNIDAR